MHDTHSMTASIADKAQEIRGRYGVIRLGLFGSHVRGDASADSDIDVLVEFSRPTFRNYMGLKHYLEELLGLRVDLVSAAALKPPLREHILAEVEYVA